MCFPVYNNGMKACTKFFAPSLFSIAGSSTHSVFHRDQQLLKSQSVDNFTTSGQPAASECKHLVYTEPLYYEISLYICLVFNK